MNTKQTLKALAAGLTLAVAASSASAIPEIDDGTAFAIVTRMERMDADKDGMVSKKEFLDTMARVWDMKAKQMKATGGRFTEAQMREVLMYLRAGA